MGNSVFYANNVAQGLSGDTDLLNGKKNYFRNISLGNRLSDNLQLNMIVLQKQFKSTLTDIRKINQIAGLYIRLLSG